MNVFFSINPTEAEHMSNDVATTIKILEKHKIANQVGPMGTSLNGEWNEIMDAIKECEQAVLKKHNRVITFIIIDNKKGYEHSLEGSIEAVKTKI